MPPKGVAWTGRIHPRRSAGRCRQLDCCTATTSRQWRRR